MLVDSVVPTHSISEPTPETKNKKNNINHYLPMKKTVTLNQLSSPFQVDF